MLKELTSLLSLRVMTSMQKNDWTTKKMSNQKVLQNGKVIIILMVLTTPKTRYILERDPQQLQWKKLYFSAKLKRFAILDNALVPS